MTLHLFKTTAAAAAILLVGTATAAAEDAGITICSRMLEASLPHMAGNAPKFRIELLNKGHVDTEQAYEAGETTYDLRVVEAGSARPTGSAACKVNEDGEVIALLLEQRAEDVPSLAERF
jgi:hypothetical protein